MLSLDKSSDVNMVFFLKYVLWIEIDLLTNEATIDNFVYSDKGHTTIVDKPDSPWNDIVALQ